MVQFVQFQNVPDSRWWPGPLEGSSRFSQPGNESSRFFPGKFQGKSYLLPDSCAHSIIDNHCSWHLQYIVLLQLNNSDTAKVAGKIWIRIWYGKASLKLISKLVKCVSPFLNQIKNVPWRVIRTVGSFTWAEWLNFDRNVLEMSYYGRHNSGKSKFRLSSV